MDVSKVPFLPPTIDKAKNRQLVQLLSVYAERFGWVDGKIDLSTDLADVTLPSATFTAHSPLWGTKPGKEKAVPATEVRANIKNNLLPYFSLARHGMQIAFHPDGESVCLFLEVRGKLKACPCFNVMTVPVLFLVKVAREGKAAPRIAEFHERAAKSAEAGAAVLVQLGWPAGTTFSPYMAFGAAS
jgi:hypothetical protein